MNMSCESMVTQGGDKWLDQERLIYIHNVLPYGKNGFPLPIIVRVLMFDDVLLASLADKTVGAGGALVLSPLGDP